MTTEQEVLKDLKKVTLEELDEAIRAVDKQEQEDSIEILENTELDINTIDNVDLYTYSMAVKTVLSMLEEKDKIIDLMAEIINNNDIDEDICKQMGQKENCNEFEDKEKCKECIKQYFENKAKELLNK